MTQQQDHGNQVKYAHKFTGSRRDELKQQQQQILFTKSRKQKKYKITELELLLEGHQGANNAVRP